MPDFVDKVFEYTSKILGGTNAVLQNVYSTTADTLQSSIDSTKVVGETVLNGTKGVYSKAQEIIPQGFEVVTNATGLSKVSHTPAPTGVTDRLVGFLTKNVFTIGLGIAFPAAGFAAYNVYRTLVPYQRYAKRLQNRYRYEVVLVVGSMNSTFVSKLVNDLNNRGYVVFVTVSDEQELRLVEEYNDQDIKPLVIDYTNDSSVRNSLLKLGQFLDMKISSIFEESYYNFKGVLVIPDYSKLPKLKSLEELSSREFSRVTENFFLKFNTLLYNGLLTFIRESNSRRDTVESYNGQKVEGGYSKLLFVNFLVVPSNDNRRLVHTLALEMNRLLYNKLYQDHSVSIKESFLRLVKKPSNISQIDMTMLDIYLHKNSNSTLVSDSVFHNVLSRVGKKLSPKQIHHKIFDLLNHDVLMKNYKIEN